MSELTTAKETTHVSGQGTSNMDGNPVETNGKEAPVVNTEITKDQSSHKEKPKRKYKSAGLSSSIKEENKPKPKKIRKSNSPKKNSSGPAKVKTEAPENNEFDLDETVKDIENTFYDLEQMESIELLTEHLAKKQPQPDGQDIIAGELVSGFCKSLSVYYCTECKYVFPLEMYYTEHKKAGQCIFICYTCGESFTFKNYSSYLKHLRTHNTFAGGSGAMFGSDLQMTQPIPKNTLRVNICVAEKFRKYLRSNNVKDFFESFDEETLAKHLKGFYTDARTRDGGKYRVHSYENLRYSLSRYLKSPPHCLPYDILNGPAFSEANASFNVVLAEVKEIWKGSTQQHQMLKPSDLVAIYDSDYLDPSTAQGLLNRVQMNIRLFFSRQSREYGDKYTKETFTVDVFPTGKRCVVRQNEIINEYMPEDLINPALCPVKTFETYLSKLNPSCDRLWQIPRESYKHRDKTWYQNKPIGRDTLGKFMAKLQSEIPLSLNYTNHSIRLTGNSFYTRMKLTPEQILAATKMKT